MTDNKQKDPILGGDRKPQKPKLPQVPKFNFYWIFGIIGLLLFFMIFRERDLSLSTTWFKVENEMMH